MAEQPKSLADSIWFWVHLFSVFALITLFLFRDKLVDLRTQRAQNFERRQAVQEIAAGGEGEADLSERSSEQWKLVAIFVLLGGIATVSWWQLWRTYLRHRWSQTAGPDGLDS